MSEYDELMNGLRERAEHAATDGNMTAACDARYFAQSADAIERLVFLREAWVGAAEDYVRRAEAAESEVERLKGVLKLMRDATEGGPDHVSDDDIWAIHDAARKALEAKP